MNDVLLNKKVSLERCVRQVRAYFRLETGQAFAEDYLRQDAIAMNLQRAAELCIDMANHLVRKHKLGLPQESRESFSLLQDAGLIDAELAARLKGMVGFRNVLVHEYRKLDLNLLLDVVEHRLDDLLRFAQLMLEAGEE
ncbi:MAG: type VII toxin-antitoxin system HepT family RNase toxin [Wenzhouxiangella sp.]